MKDLGLYKEVDSTPNSHKQILFIIDVFLNFGYLFVCKRKYRLS